VFRDDVDRLFAELFPAGAGRSSHEARAPVDVYLADETPPELVVELDVAGLDPADVQVALHGDVLMVRGVRRRHGDGSLRTYQHAEIAWGPFQRRLRLNVAVDADGAVATYDQGILRVRLPLSSRPPARRVSITVRDPA
jgi:HSP20 family protein